MSTDNGFETQTSEVLETSEVWSSGFKETEIGPIPVEWEVATIGELAQNKVLRLQSGFPCGNHNQEGKGIPHLRPFNVDDEGNVALDTIKYIETDRDVEGYLLAPGDVLFNNTNSEELVGKTAYWDRPGRYVFSNHMTLVRVLNDDVVDSFYLSKYLHKLWYDRFYRGICRRHVNQASISLTRLKGVPIPLPPLPEQRRIAHVLRTIQRAIAAQDKLIAAARELKRSLMQHLFTYGPVPLDQAGQVPLKETEIGPLPEHWEVVRLGEIVDVKGGKRLPKGHKFADGPTDHPYIRVVDFKNNSVDKTNLRFITPEDFERIKRYTISSEDVYISIAGTTGLVGTIPEDLDGANLTENAAKLIIKDKKRLLKHFLVYALASERGQSEIKRRTTKTNQPKLALMRIKQIVIPFPSPAEQQRIAHMLSAVDRKIEAEEQRKAALQALFKTMLHQLMTGQVRV